MKYLVVTDLPAPWREKVYESLYEKLGSDFHVAYCNDREKRRLWKFPLGRHPKTFLKKTLHLRWGEKEKYLNLGIIPILLKYKPKVVICESFNPTIFLTFFISKLQRSKIAYMGDTWLGRDKNLSPLQKIIRKSVYHLFAKVCIGASREALKWFKYYNKNIPDESLFISHLCADNEYFNKQLEGKPIRKNYEIMYSGRISREKNPLFIPEVASRIKEKIGTCKVLVIGDGNEELKAEMFERFEQEGIDYRFSGFIEHRKLPEFYSQAKILLLPTSGDCWGVVINEALVCGVPVITTHMTAAAGELVIDGENGYVLPLDAELWAERICPLLEDQGKYDLFSKRAKETVSRFTFERAAQGVLSAIQYLEQLQ